MAVNKVYAYVSELQNVRSCNAVFPEGYYNNGVNDLPIFIPASVKLSW